MAALRIARRLAHYAIVLVLLGQASAAEGQLPSPAREAAEQVLSVVRSGDRARIRELIETRFTPAFIQSAPMDYHVPIFASLGRQVAGLEVGGVTLDGPTNVSLMLEGPGNRLDLRIRVEPEPPHRVQYLGWGNAGPELKSTSLADLGPELDLLANRPPFSGVVLAARQGEIDFHQAYGTADLTTGRPNRPDTRFDLGSLNKLFTSTVVLRLAQDGRLELEEPIGKYLDGFDAAVAERVTIRHLLEHRSGFGDYLTHPQFEADPKRFRRPSDFLPLARAQQLAFQPGVRQSYSNMGFVLLGAIIERVTARDYHDVVNELVFAPSQMTSAGPAGGAEAARRYELQHGRFVSTDSLYPDMGTPAGGGFAAAIDLYRFVKALLDHRLLNERNTALLLHNFRTPPDSAALPERFGFEGGAPGVNAIMIGRVPERQVVIVFANIDPVEAGLLARSIEALAR